MWGNTTFFHRAKSIEKNIEILTQSIEKSFLIDPLTIINAICHDSLTLRIKSYLEINVIANFCLVLRFTQKF